MSFINWRTKLDSSIQAQFLELPGRGKKFKEALVDTMEEALQILYRQFIHLSDGFEYAFFGHSMGSMLAFELSHKLRADGYPPPVHLFLSGRYAPQIIKDTGYSLRLNDRQILNEVIRYGGMPEELLGDEQFLTWFVKVLRADLRVIHSYRYVEYPKKLSCSFTLLHGSEDHLVTLDEQLQWNLHTDRPAEVLQFDGGHFFIHSFAHDILNIINKRLSTVGRLEEET